MKKTTILPILLILAVSLVVFIFLKKLGNKPFESQIGGDLNLTPVIYEIVGTIIEVKASSIIVEEKLESEKRKIEIIITPETLLKNQKVFFTQEQMQSGKNFNPDMEIQVGKFSDFKTGMGAYKIITSQNPTETDKITAIEVNYLTNEFPLLLLNII